MAEWIRRRLRRWLFPYREVELRADKEMIFGPGGEPLVELRCHAKPVPPPKPA